MSDVTSSVELLPAPPPSTRASIGGRPRSFSSGTYYRPAATGNLKPSAAQSTSPLTNGSPPSATQKQQSRYKTELCRPFQEYGHCRYGEKCQFAHGKDDLRIPIRHPKYKTEFCRTYHSQGYCPYGARCHFVHSTVEARPPPPPGPPTGITGPRPTSGLGLGGGTTATGTFISFIKPPLSPSQDSGISSPEGTPNSFLNTKVFEYPSSDGSSSSDDQDIEIYDTQWKNASTDLATSLQFPSDWETLSNNDTLSPVKLSFSIEKPYEDLTEKFSTTSLDEGLSPAGRPRLPVFNQLNSLSDTALSVWQ